MSFVFIIFAEQFKQNDYGKDNIDETLPSDGDPASL